MNRNEQETIMTQTANCLSLGDLLEDDALPRADRAQPLLHVGAMHHGKRTATRLFRRRLFLFRRNIFLLQRNDFLFRNRFL